MIAAIPSPGFNSIGPFRLYGLMIALGVLIGIEIATRRWRARGGDPEDIGAIAIWVVPVGLIGTRLYHVATDWKTYRDAPLDALKIWDGGLGIPGGILAGLLVGVWVVRRMGIRPSVAIDVILPTLPLAQAIGRFGNWFNQELFGRPTDLPWGLQIDPEHRPIGYEQTETFHPTFLYEGLWNVGLFFLLLRLDRTRKLRPGSVLPLYVLGYGIGRFWVELMRIDPASLVLGVRINLWVSGLMVLGSVVVFAVRGVRRRPDDEDGPYLDGHIFEPHATHAERAQSLHPDAAAELDPDPDPDPERGATGS